MMRKHRYPQLDLSECHTDPFSPTGAGTVASPYFSEEQVIDWWLRLKVPACPSCWVTYPEPYPTCLCGKPWRDRTDHVMVSVQELEFNRDQLCRRHARHFAAAKADIERELKEKETKKCLATWNPVGN